MPLIEPFLEPLDSNGDYILPTTQYIANAAIIVVFAYLVLLTIMEVNYFRFAVFRASRGLERRAPTKEEGGSLMLATGASGGIAIAPTASSSSSSLPLSAASDEVDEAETSTTLAGVSEGKNDNDAQRRQSHHQSISSSLNLNNQSSCHSAIGLLMQGSRFSRHRRNQAEKKKKKLLLVPMSIKTKRRSDDGNCNNSDNNDVNTDDIHNNNNVISTAVNGCTSATATSTNINPNLQLANNAIATSSLFAITTSLVLYTITAIVISINTRGLQDEVVAIITGISKFFAAVIVFILSAKFPQWIGVYHEGTIRLAKCSSNLSIHFMKMDLSNDENNRFNEDLSKLRHHVKLGVWFHFAKFYILLMPFYCGVRPITIPFSIIIGSISGLVLIWCILLVHERYINRRNIVAFITIFFCSVMSSLLFVRGMAWIQVIWDLALKSDEDAILAVSFFGWLFLMLGIHALFIWHTLRVEKAHKIRQEEEEEEEVDTMTVGATMVGVLGGNGMSGSDDVEVANGNDDMTTIDSKVRSKRSSKIGGGQSGASRRSSGVIKRTGSYDSYLFDPRFHENSFHGLEDRDHDQKMMGLSPSRSMVTTPSLRSSQEEMHDNTGVYNNVKSVVASSGTCTGTGDATISADIIDNHGNVERRNKRRLRPEWCEIFTCFPAEYKKMSCLWKMISWIRGVVILTSNVFCFYFVIVVMGATHQIASTQMYLPSIREALYETQNEGPVCAFDNRGVASNITTFENKEAAHHEGFLVLHCGACGACSSWENLIVEYTTRDNMAALANKCAMKGLLGGIEGITKCIERPPIAFTGQCAVCWAEDIVCTKQHCSFIFLQSQITNNVANFAVGPDEITSASCEEAHCEVGAFVPCSGATRRRMNIVSEIPRPVEEQCRIVDVDWAELFAEYDV